MSSPADSDSESSQRPSQARRRATSALSSSSSEPSVSKLLTARTSNGATLLARVIVPTPHLLPSFVQTFTQALILFLGQGIRKQNKDAKKKQSIAGSTSSSSSSNAVNNGGSSNVVASFAPAPPLADETDSLDSVDIMITIIRYNRDGNRDNGALWIRPAETKPMCRMLPSTYVPIVFSRDDVFPKPGSDPSIIVNAFKFLTILKMAAKFKSVKQRRMFGISFCDTHYDVIFPEYRTDDVITAAELVELRPEQRKKKKKNKNKKYTIPDGADDEANDIEGNDAVSISSEEDDDDDDELVVRFDKQPKTREGDMPGNDGSGGERRSVPPPMEVIDDEAHLLKSHNLRAAFFWSTKARLAQGGIVDKPASSTVNDDPFNDIEVQQNEKKRKRDALLATGVVTSEQQFSVSVASMQPLRVMPNLIQRFECSNQDDNFRIHKRVPNVLYALHDEYLLRPTDHVPLDFSCKVLHDMVQTWNQSEDNAKLMLSVTHRLMPPLADGDVQCRRIVKFSVHGQCKQVFETVITKRLHPLVWSEIYECAVYDARLLLSSGKRLSTSEEERDDEEDDDDEMVALDADGNVIASPSSTTGIEPTHHLPSPTRKYILLALPELLIILREVLRCTDDASFTIMYPRQHHRDIRYTVAPVTLGDKPPPAAASNNNASSSGGKGNTSATSTTPSRCWKLKLIGDMIPADDMTPEELSEMLGGNSKALAGMSFHQHRDGTTQHANGDDYEEAALFDNDTDLVEDASYTNFVQQIDLDEAGDVREDSRKAAAWDM